MRRGCRRSRALIKHDRGPSGGVYGSVNASTSRRMGKDKLGFGETDAGTSSEK